MSIKFSIHAARRLAHRKWVQQMLAVFERDTHRSWGRGWNRAQLATALRILPSLATQRAVLLVKHRILAVVKNRDAGIGAGQQAYRLAMLPAGLVEPKKSGAKDDVGRRMMYAFRHGNRVAMLALLRELEHEPCMAVSMHKRAHLRRCVARAAKERLLAARMITRQKNGTYTVNEWTLRRLADVGERLKLPLCLVRKERANARMS